MKAIIVFDGVCGFCNAYVQFVLERDPLGYFSFVSAQSAMGEQLRRMAGNTPPDSIVLVDEGVVYIRSEAILRIGRRLAGPWRWIWWLRWVPRPLRDGLYDVFARYRYQFGTTASCQLPTPDQRKRILLTHNQTQL
ncbi:thiol-disulfide oxidoreductase DCC family protein [Spirosoma montaniterrae]|uniref:Thiol-disulfide oxidoreductase n=1 Tax=Spirosoma montaniterrae TaxID=1178516 RepID=A0A1P9WZ73_9BACT|nr:DCC1-like thiol-disulfide oxidoreductase family protein [Spirosoma montaniterrae]AQG80663.1 hypothetical protein AWR27_15815 [Spirosoma montaniterrae]